MARLTIVPKSAIGGEAITIDSNAAFSLLNNLLMNEIAIPHICGGRAKCGSCRVTVHSGAAGMNPISAEERERLEAVAAGPDMRLACQTRIARDATITIALDASESHE